MVSQRFLNCGKRLLRGSDTTRNLCFVLCCAGSIVGCERDTGDAIRQFDTAGVFANEDALPAQAAEWMQSTTHKTGATPEIEAFSTSGGLAVMLQRNPKMLWKFILADKGRINGGPVLAQSTGYQPALGEPSDILGVTSEGQAIVLDPSTGRIVSDDIGGRHHLLSDYRFKNSVRSGCALGEEQLALIDNARSGIITVQNTSTPQRSHVLTLPAKWPGESQEGWESARLSGAIGRLCVLWQASVSTAFLLTDSGVKSVDFHDRNRDVASCPRGPAVVPRGRMHGGQVVRFFDESGLPIGVLRLDREILRIGCTPHRLIVMAAKKDSMFVGSYVLPAHLRTAPLVIEPTVIAPFDPNSSRNQPPN